MGVTLGSEEGSYVRLIDFLYRSILGSRVKKKKKKMTFGGGVTLGRCFSRSREGGRSSSKSSLSTA